MKEFKGKTAVVTGAGGGIGRSIALALADVGMNVVVSDIQEDNAKKVAEEVAAFGVGSLAVKTDVSKIDSVEALADAAYGKFGTVEMLVNNAGVSIHPYRASWDTSYEDYKWCMDINYWGVVFGHQVFVPRMRNTPGEKHIVTTSSMASLMSPAGSAAYSASKAAVDGFSNAAREELKTQNIGLTLLHPLGVRTNIVENDKKMRPRENIKPWSDYVSDSLNAVVDTINPDDAAADPDYASSPAEFINPSKVGYMVIEAIKENKPHVFTHPVFEVMLKPRWDAILAGSQPFPQR